MTELNDHLKLLYARAAQLFDQKTARLVRHDTRRRSMRSWSSARRRPAIRGWW